MSNYEPVIGLEVHVELNTKTKMFCGCSGDYFGKEPNTQTCPICLGLPGSLPYINREAIEKCIKIGLALGCKVNNKSLFERKNYFYPDLAKGYQISQLRWPLCTNGFIEAANSKGEKTKIRINRVHQEEDTAKLMHQKEGTVIDFNRSGVPLVEIVTEPDFKDTEEIRDYAKKLQQVCRTLKVSNADMEKGDMRLEANVSVRPEHVEGLPNYRVELKNINSFRFMVAAVEYEIKRQIEELEKGNKIHQQTRGWDEDKKQTFLQRTKEEANDYRYFPEPDLSELKTEESRVKSLESSLPELPWDQAERYFKDFGIKEADAKILVEELILSEFFEEAVKYGKSKGIEPQQVANYLINHKIDLIDSTPQLIIDGIVAKSIGILDDEGQLEEMAREVIEQNPQMVAVYKKGKITVIQALVGLVMRKLKGKANAGKIKEILEKLLG